MTERAELLRFLMVGAMNFVFTFIVFTLALKFFHLDHLLALLTSWFFGNFLTYILNFNWVFRPEASFAFGWRFLKYSTAGSISISINLIALYVLADIGGYDPFWSQVAIMPIIIIFNFLAAKFWALRKSDTQP